MKKQMIIAACLLAEAAVSATASEHRNDPADQGAKPDAACIGKRSQESGLQIYFSAHQSAEEELGV